MNIYKCKLNGVFYVVIEKIDDTYFRAINIEDKYSYTIPIEDLELWLEFEDNTSNKIKAIVAEWKADTWWTDNVSYECMQKIADLLAESEE